MIFSKEMVFSIVRHSMTFIGGAMIGANILPDLNADGSIDHLDTQVFVSAVMVIIAILWSGYDAFCKKRDKEVIKEVKAISPLTVVTAEKNVKEKNATKKKTNKANSG